MWHSKYISPCSYSSTPSIDETGAATSSPEMHDNDGIIMRSCQHVLYHELQPIKNCDIWNYHISWLEYENSIYTCRLTRIKGSNDFTEYPTPVGTSVLSFIDATIAAFNACQIILDEQTPDHWSHGDQFVLR